MTLPLAYAPMYGSRGENRTLKLTRLKRAHMPIFWYSAKFMVLATGFGPASSTLKGLHSTIKLRQHVCSGGSTKNRTPVFRLRAESNATIRWTRFLITIFVLENSVTVTGTRMFMTLFTRYDGFNFLTRILEPTITLFYGILDFIFGYPDKIIRQLEHQF